MATPSPIIVHIYDTIQDTRDKIRSCHNLSYPEIAVKRNLERTLVRLITQDPKTLFLIGNMLRDQNKPEQALEYYVYAANLGLKNATSAVAFIATNLYRETQSSFYRDLALNYLTKVANRFFQETIGNQQMCFPLDELLSWLKNQSETKKNKTATMLLDTYKTLDIKSASSSISPKYINADPTPEPTTQTIASPPFMQIVPTAKH